MLTAHGSVGATVGVGTRHQPLELVEQADAALYEAKAAGKGVVRRFGAAAGSHRDSAEPVTAPPYPGPSEPGHRQPDGDRRRAIAAP